MKKRYEISVFCFLLIGVMALMSCKMMTKSRSVSFSRETFDINKAKWDDTGSGRDYRFTYSETGFLPAEYIVEVVDGVTTVKNQRGYTDDDDIPQSIEELFDSILNFYEKYNGVVAADNEFFYTGIEVEYDSVYGYPTKIYHDSHIPDNLAVDGNFLTYIKDFSIIE